MTRERLRFAGACAVLLVSGLAVGCFFEMRQNTMMDAVIGDAVSRQQQLCQRDLTISLHEVARAENAFRAKEGLYAPSWAALAAVVSPSTTLPYGFEVRLCRSAEKPGERFCAIVVPPKTSYAYPALAKAGVWPRVSLDEKGVHTHSWSDTPLVLDEEQCRAIAADPQWVAR